MNIVGKSTLVLALGCAALLSATSASAAVVNGGLSVSDPTFNGVAGCGNLSVVGTNVYYDVFNLSVSIAGGFDLSLTSAFDNTLTIYNGAFNPADARTNCFASNDDLGMSTNAGFNNLTLSSGTSYFAVVSSFANGATGSYQLSAVADQGNTTGGVASLSPFSAAAPVPLPAAAWLLLSGLGGLGFMRKRKAA